MKANTNYGTKEQHGLKWGLYELVNGHKIQLESRGGNARRLKDQNLDRVQHPLLQMGNIWVHKDLKERGLFRHPDQIHTRNLEWYVWDNPQLPHLLYKGSWNPHGYKNWLRIVKGNTATTADTPLRQGQTGAERINEQLRQLTGNTITQWQQIVGKRRAVVPRGKRVLICPSGAGIFDHYYGIDKSSWINKRRRQIEAMGYEVVVRDKPSRGSREVNQNKLCEILAREDFAFTVSIHSVGPVESLIAGTPAVVEGRHAGGPCATPWSEFKETGTVRTPERESVDLWVERLLCDTFHKTEAYSGKWY